MSLGQDIADALPALRAQAESMMTETVIVGSYVEGIDDDTLQPTRELTTEHYTGAGQIKYPTLTVSEGTAASQQIATADVVLKVPVSVSTIRQGDLVHVTASIVDGSLADRWFRVKAWPQSGHVTAHRYPIEEVS